MSREDVQMEKLDFSNSLEDGNVFGIEDTQIIANKDLSTFLLTDPDQVKKVEEKEPEPDTSRKPEVPGGTEDLKSKKETKENTVEVGRKSLEGALFDEAESEDEDSKDFKETPINPGKKVSEEEDTYSTLSKDLMRLGVFTKTFEDESEEDIDIKNPEQFLERFNLEKKKGAVDILENFLSQFGEDYRKMFDAIFVNGVKPDEYLNAFSKIDSFRNINLEDEIHQERVMRAYYKELKLEDSKIENKIQKLKDYGDLEDEAKDAHSILLAKEEENVSKIEQKKIDEQKQERERDEATSKSYQRIISEKLKVQEVDGIPITRKDAEEVFTYLTDKPYKLASGEKITEFDKDIMELNRPENHELKIKLGLLLRKKLDLTSVKKTTISKKSDSLFTLSTRNAKQKDSKEKEIKSFF
jgi:hypothetical protein